MKTVLTYHQEKIHLLGYDLDAIDALLIDYIQHIAGRDFSRKMVMNGRTYVLLRPSFLEKNCPGLGKADTLYRRIKRLSKPGQDFIIPHPDNEVNRESYYALGEKVYNMYDRTIDDVRKQTEDSPTSEASENNPNPRKTAAQSQSEPSEFDPSNRNEIRTTSENNPNHIGKFSDNTLVSNNRDREKEKKENSLLAHETDQEESNSKSSAGFSSSPTFVVTVPQQQVPAQNEEVIKKIESIVYAPVIRTTEVSSNQAEEDDQQLGKEIAAKLDYRRKLMTAEGSTSWGCIQQQYHIERAHYLRLVNGFFNEKISNVLDGGVRFTQDEIDDKVQHCKSWIGTELKKGSNSLYAPANAHRTAEQQRQQRTSNTETWHDLANGRPAVGAERTGPTAWELHLQRLNNGSGNHGISTL